MEVKLYDGIEPDPTVKTVIKGGEAMREYQPDWKIGGGSAIELRQCG